MRNPAPTPGAGPSEKDAARPATTPSVARPADEYRDLARELVAAIESIADTSTCDCDLSLTGECDCNTRERVRELADDAHRRLWLAEIEADRGPVISDG